MGQAPLGDLDFETVEGRGAVDYLMRNSQQHLVALSAQADLKANIIITASALMLTVGVGRLDDDRVRVSVGILSVGCLAALFLAVLTVLPIVTARSRANLPRNPLFFIDVAAMDQAEFRQRLADACKTDAGIYRLQVDDLYEFSRFLAGSKYRRLRRAYLAFLAGVVSASVYQLIVSFR